MSIHPSSILSHILYQTTHLEISIASGTDRRSEYEVSLVEEHELTAGPLSLLQTATRTHTQVLISCRNNRKV